MAAEVATRLHPGTSLAHAFPAPSAPPSLASLDSAFELQEYLALLLRYDPHAVEELTKLPMGGDGEEIEKWAWVYEQTRRLVQDMNHPLITRLQEECTREGCPVMRANEWTYVCSAHGSTQTTMGSCCAIDYILHTMDHTTALLNSPKNFPSRLSIPPASHRLFTAIARRLARVFAHAYFHHREVFEESEVEHSVYARFNALVRTYEITDPEFLMIPSASSSDSESTFGTELTRTSTMVQFTALNLSDTPPSSDEAQQGSGIPEQSALAKSIASPSHEAVNAVEEAAFTPSPAVLAASPGLSQIPLPEIPPAPQSPEGHPNALVIYPPVGGSPGGRMGRGVPADVLAEEADEADLEEGDEAQEMDVVDMDMDDADLHGPAGPLRMAGLGGAGVVKAPDQPRAADVVEAESAPAAERVEMHMSGETDAADKVETEADETEYIEEAAEAVIPEEEGEEERQEEEPAEIPEEAGMSEALREAQEENIAEATPEPAQ